MRVAHHVLHQTTFLTLVTLFSAGCDSQAEKSRRMACTNARATLVEVERCESSEICMAAYKMVEKLARDKQNALEVINGQCEH
jgi:hypothetical protein